MLPLHTVGGGDGPGVAEEGGAALVQERGCNQRGYEAGLEAGRLKKLHPNCIRRFVIMEMAPTRVFSWLKPATTAFKFKTLLRHYAKRALTPRSLNVKLGPRCNYHKGRAAKRHHGK